MNLGPWEIALIFLAILLIFGAKRIPEIARGLGKGIREFKDATNDIKREIETADPTRPTPPQQQLQQPTQYQQQAYTPPQAPAQPQPTSAPADQMAPPQPSTAPPAEGQPPSA